MDYIEILFVCFFCCFLNVSLLINVGGGRHSFVSNLFCSLVYQTLRCQRVKSSTSCGWWCCCWTTTDVRVFWENGNSQMLCLCINIIKTTCTSWSFFLLFFSFFF